jgi:hypothetical protein
MLRQVDLTHAPGAYRPHDGVAVDHLTFGQRHGRILVDLNRHRAMSGWQRHGANRPGRHVAEEDAHPREANGHENRTDPDRREIDLSRELIFSK